MEKQQAMDLVNSKDRGFSLSAKNTHWANLSLYGQDKGWWVNIPFARFEERLYIILNDEKISQFVLLAIPSNSLVNPRSVFRNKGNTADIFVSYTGNFDLLKDNQSNGTNYDFSSYQMKIFDYLETVNTFENIFPDEVPSTLKEGSKKTITVNAYERNPKARTDCLGHYGFSCAVCDFRFFDFYGDRGKGFIHVHHLKALSEVDDEYEIDPIKDLRPVCPNCHAMLHRKGNISIDELKGEIKSNKKVQSDTTEPRR